MEHFLQLFTLKQRLVDELCGMVLEDELVYFLNNLVPRSSQKIEKEDEESGKWAGVEVHTAPGMQAHL